MTSHMNLTGMRRLYLQGEKNPDLAIVFYKILCSMADIELPDYITPSTHVITSRPWPIMLKFLPIMLLSSAQKSHPLCSILCP